MSDSLAISTLVGKRATIFAEIAELEARVCWLRENLTHIDATLRVLKSGVNPDAIQPQVKSNAYRLFKVGYLSKFILDTVRQRGPINIEAITLAVMYDAGLDVDDELLRSAVRRRVQYTLRDQVRAGRLERSDGAWNISAPAKEGPSS